MLIALRRIALLAIIAAGLLSAPSVWSQSVPLSSGGSSLATPVSIADGGTNATTFTTSNGVTKYDGTRLVTGVWVDTGTLLYSTTATGLGLGTATPLTIAGTASAVTAAMHVAVTGAAGIVASGTTSAQLLAVDTDAAANAKVVSLRSVGGVGSITRFADNFGSVVDYLSANLATDVVTLGSASVAGVNYISGTGNHVFSDGDIQLNTNITFTLNGTSTISSSVGGYIIGKENNGRTLINSGVSGTTRVAPAPGDASLNGLEIVPSYGIAATTGAALYIAPTYGAGGTETPIKVAGANGQNTSLGQFQESHTLAAAGTSDTTKTIPANSRTRGVVFRITTEITGCATVDAGIAGATNRFGTFSALTAGTTLTSTDNSAYASATAIRFTCVGGGASFTAGVIRVTPFYDTLTAPTSMLPALDMMRQIAAADPQLRRAA